MPRPVERRKEEREEAETWSDDERKAIVKLGPLFEKYLTRKGKKKEAGSKSFLEELGISL